MAKHIYYAPDCPECGAEAQKCMRYRPGTQTDANPFGTAERWWVCPECGWSTDHVGTAEFDALTERLTEGMRSDG